MLDDKMGKLSEKDYIFTLLAVIIRLHDGEIRIPEEELAKITKQDAVALLYDTNSKEVVLKMSMTDNKLLEATTEEEEQLNFKEVVDMLSPDSSEDKIRDDN